MKPIPNEVMNRIGPQPHVGLHVFNDFHTAKETFQKYAISWEDSTVRWSDMTILKDDWIHHFRVIKCRTDCDKVLGMQVSALFPHENWSPESDDVAGILLSRVRPPRD